MTEIDDAMAPFAEARIKEHHAVLIRQMVAIPLERLPNHNTRGRDCERATGGSDRPTTAVSALAACGALCPLEAPLGGICYLEPRAHPSSAQRAMTIILGFA